MDQFSIVLILNLTLKCTNHQHKMKQPFQVLLNKTQFYTVSKQIILEKQTFFDSCEDSLVKIRPMCEEQKKRGSGMFQSAIFVSVRFIAPPALK